MELYGYAPDIKIVAVIVGGVLSLTNARTLTITGVDASGLGIAGLDGSCCVWMRTLC